MVKEGLSCSHGSRCHLLVADTILLSCLYWDEETETQGVVTQMLEVTQMVDGKVTLGLPVYLLLRTVLPFTHSRASLYSHHLHGDVGRDVSLSHPYALTCQTHKIYLLNGTEFTLEERKEMIPLSPALTSKV